jgi:hypothetical protein
MEKNNKVTNNKVTKSQIDKYLVALEEVQRIHSVVWYISMMTDDYIGLDEKL